VRTAVQALAPEIKAGTVKLGGQQLPPDVLAHIDVAPVPDVDVLRTRLRLHLDADALPDAPDAVDVLMHAVDPDAEEEDR
jgi:hypothetical protein